MSKFKFGVKDILIGSDPEFGVSINGVPFSVIGSLGGSKKYPMSIGEGCGLQEDNVMAELTMPPVNNKADFIKYINYGKQTIKKLIDQKTGQSCTVESSSSALYSEEQLDNEVAQKFGCEPSFCIYTKGISPRPAAHEVGNIRSAGFHIHIGVPKLLNTNQRIKLMFCMDIMLGVPSIIIDTDERRRLLYGNAGDFRVKLLHDEDYSIVEYRTLGAAMHATDELIGWCYDQTIKAVELFLSTDSLEEICKEYDILFEEVQSAIDNGDTSLCKNLIQTFNIKLPVNVPSLEKI